MIEFADRLMRHVWKKLGSKIEHDIHSYVDEHIHKILFLHLEKKRSLVRFMKCPLGSRHTLVPHMVHKHVVAAR